MNSRWLARLLSPVGFVLAALCVLLPFVTIRFEADGYFAPVDAFYQLSYAGHDMLWDGRPDLLWRTARGGDLSNGLEEIRFENVDAAYVVFAPRIDQQPWLCAVTVLVFLGVAAAALPWQRLRAVTSVATALLAALIVLATTALTRQGLIDAMSAPGGPGFELAPLDPASFVPLGYGFWLAIGLLTVVGLGNVWFAVPGRPAKPARLASAPSEDPPSERTP